MAILLTYGTARILLAGDAEAREEYMANDPCSEPGFRALLTEMAPSG